MVSETIPEAWKTGPLTNFPKQVIWVTSTTGEALQCSPRFPVEDIKEVLDSIKAGKRHQDALQRLQVPGCLQQSAYRRLQRDHGCETRVYFLPLSVYLGDRLSFETSD